MTARRKPAPTQRHAGDRRITLPAGVKAPARTLHAMLRDAMEIVCDDGTTCGENASLAWTVCSVSLGYLPPVHVAEALTAYQRAEDEGRHGRATDGARSRESIVAGRKVLALALEFCDLHLAKVRDEDEARAVG